MSHNQAQHAGRTGSHSNGRRQNHAPTPQQAPEEPSPPPPGGAGLEQLRSAFRGPFQTIFFCGFALIAVYAIGTLIVVGVVAWQGQNPLINVTAALRILQMSLGMVIGFFTIFLGLLASWMGIEAKYRVEGRSASAAVTFVNASPGIVLILCGAVIFCTGLLKNITVERTYNGPSILNKSAEEGKSPTPPVNPSDGEYGQ